jgi:hypothetical protein
VSLFYRWATCVTVNSIKILKILQWKAKICPCLIVELHVAVNSAKLLKLLLYKWNNEINLQCCRATKYFFSNVKDIKVLRSSCEVPFSPILTKFGFYGQVLIKPFIIEFFENPSSGYRIYTCRLTDGWIDRHDQGYRRFLCLYESGCWVWSSYCRSRFSEWAVTHNRSERSARTERYGQSAATDWSRCGKLLTRFNRQRCSDPSLELYVHYCNGKKMRWGMGSVW